LFRARGRPGLPGRRAELPGVGAAAGRAVVRPPRPHRRRPRLPSRPDRNPAPDRRAVRARGPRPERDHAMTLRPFLLPLLLTLGLAACGGPEPDAHAHGEGADHDDHAETEAEPAKGAHNGRLLTEGPYTVELAIVEDGVPPEYRAWLYKDGEPLPPTAGELTVVLS